MNAGTDPRNQGERAFVTGWTLSRLLGEDLYDDVTSNHTTSPATAGRSDQRAAWPANRWRTGLRDVRGGRLARDSLQPAADHHLFHAVGGGRLLLEQFPAVSLPQV